MPTYQYLAKNSSGKDITGTAEAASVAALVSTLKRDGLVVINIEEPGGKKGKGKKPKKGIAAAVPVARPVAKAQKAKAKGKRRKVKTRDLAIFCQQFSTMLRAGMPIIDSIETMATENVNLNFQEVLLAIRDDVEAGESLSEALGKHPRTFPLMFRAMIEAGEASGSLTKIIQQLGQYLKRRDALQKKVKSAAMYPTFVIVFFTIIVAFILLFLVPQFEAIFSSMGAELPALTLLLLNASRLVKGNILLVIAGIIGLIIGWKKYSASAAGSAQIDRVLLKVPIFGGLVQKAGVARFAMSLSTLLHNGVSLDQSLDIVSRVAGNVVLEEATQHVRESIITGEGLAESMGRYEIYPPMLCKMVAVGEESGSLSEMLADIADYYEDDVNQAIEGISSIIEPVMIVMIGAVVAVTVLALYMPIFMIGKVTKDGIAN